MRKSVAVAGRADNSSPGIVSPESATALTLRSSEFNGHLPVARPYSQLFDSPAREAARAGPRTSTLVVVY
jgi:hypothetical protein